MRRRLPGVVVVGVPVAAYCLLAWNRRWMSDDGFINLRIVWNVLHGHGPVYNIGERVEAGTSPLWILVLVVARTVGWFADPGLVAVLAGIGLAAAGVALAIVGARCWWRSLGHEAGLPLGAVALVSLPPMWDFASSGLETGLIFAWLGASWAGVASRLGDGEPRPSWRPGWLPALLGLGPLVRPDLALFSVAFAVALVATSRVDRRGAVRALAQGLAAPLAYQVFRMGYYGLLVPNTALAKQADQSNWSRGWSYLRLYLQTTGVGLFVVLLAATLVVGALTCRPSRRHVVVAAAPMAGAVLHAVYIVRVGGDFMFARMLLPATFALLCPSAALPGPLPARDHGRPKVADLPAGLMAAAVVIALALFGGREAFDDVDNVGVADERALWIGLIGDPHPATLASWDRGPMPALSLLGLPVEGRLFLLGWVESFPAPRTAVGSGTLGYHGVRLAGTYIVDYESLADPVGSHMTISSQVRAGHEKPLPKEWILARHAAPAGHDPDIAAARHALACGDLAELVDAVDDPLTPGRFLRNLAGSVRRTGLRVPRDPDAARRAFCGD